MFDLEMLKFSNYGNLFEVECSSENHASAVLSTLFALSDELSPTTFCAKMEKTRPMRTKVDGKVFISRLKWRFSISFFTKVLSPNCTLTWFLKNYASHKGKALNRKTKVPKHEVW